MYKQSSAWVARVQQTNKSLDAAQGIYYSKVGAMFQEWAIANLDAKGSIAHSAIGRLVTAINTGSMPVDVAKAIYIGLLGK